MSILDFILGLFRRPPALGGNHNYVLWDWCRPLVNPSVRLVAGSDVRADGNWDLQVNAYAPSRADAYMQFVVAVTTTGEVQWSIENWPVSGDNLFNTCDHHLYQLPGDYLPKDWSLGVGMNTDDKVTSVDFSVSDGGPLPVASVRVPLDATLPLCNGSWKDDYLSQVVGFEPNVVGYNGGVRVRFAPFSAVLECRAQSIATNRAIPACAEAKATTVEDSNARYAPASQVSPSFVTVGVSA